MKAAAPAAIGVELDRLSRRFTHTVKGEVFAARDVSLKVAPGEFLTLLGPSGCGKTTTLRMIAGFETPDSGRVVFGGQDVTLLPANQRGIGFVFQNYALFPHLSVFENVAYGLRVRGQSREAIAPSSSVPACCCSTSPCRISTPGCACRCATKSAPCSGAWPSRRSTSRTTRRRRWRYPTASQ
jgi:ABC-type sugar transport system ATPase subunit